MVTFCWLTDPMGSLELVFERLLRPGGVLVLGGLQLFTDGDDCFDDQKWLSGLADFLVADGHQVEVFADSQNGLYSWLMIRRNDKHLNLTRCITFAEKESIHADSLKAIYAIHQPVLESYAKPYFSGTPVPSTRLRFGGQKELASRGDKAAEKFKVWLD